uniref:Terminase small subunit n=1 Tax=Caulobacter phage BL57 TaxID=3348355 RepID=A0AB74ULW8_9VIRU
MPRLANDRHEMYAMMRAKGMMPAQAAQAAGFVKGSSTYAQLEKDPEVQARAQELVEENNAKREQMRAANEEAARIVGQMAGVNKAWVIQKLAENAQNAAQDGDYKESNAALKLIGEEFAMFQGASAEGRENGAGERVFDLDNLTAVLQPAAKIIAPKVTQKVDPQAAFDLIAGNSTAAKRQREARAFSEGGDADAAFTEEADIDAIPDGAWSGPSPDDLIAQEETATEPDAPEDDDKITWEPIDPKTPAADILDRVARAAQRQNPEPTDDDRPKRRSSR